MKNIELFDKIADIIEETPERYNQDYWIDKSREDVCGTAHCVAGWAIALTHGPWEEVSYLTEEWERVRERYDSRLVDAEHGAPFSLRGSPTYKTEGSHCGIIGVDAANLLGLDYEDANDLFGDGWMKGKHHKLVADELRMIARGIARPEDGLVANEDDDDDYEPEI